jgi:hypothetical protein
VLLVAGGGFPDEIPASRLYRDAGGATDQLWSCPDTGHTAGLRTHPPPTSAAPSASWTAPGSELAARAPPRRWRGGAAARVAAARGMSHSRQIQRVTAPVARELGAPLEHARGRRRASARSAGERSPERLLEHRPRAASHAPRRAPARRP